MREGNAFAYLTANLPQERMSIAISAQASSERAIDLTVDYTRERKAFGTPIASFQNTKFVLAGLSAKVEAGRHMVDRALEELDAGTLSGPDAARVKLFTTEVQAEVMDACLQLHGGYGYMLEYPIARMYADARVSRIYGGSSEIMKVIIAKTRPRRRRRPGGRPALGCPRGEGTTSAGCPLVSTSDPSA